MNSCLENEKLLLEFLKPKPGERFSKVEAYYNLLSRCVTKPYIYNRYNTQILIGCGQFVSTIKALAGDWGWHRPTVITFLEGLKVLGFIDYTKHYSSMVFTMLQSQNYILNSKDDKDSIILFDLFMEHYFQGNISIEQVGQISSNICERFCVNNAVSAIAESRENKKMQNCDLMFSLTLNSFCSCVKESLRKYNFTFTHIAERLLSNSMTVSDLLVKYKKLFDIMTGDKETEVKELHNDFCCLFKKYNELFEAITDDQLPEELKEIKTQTKLDSCHVSSVRD